MRAAATCARSVRVCSPLYDDPCIKSGSEPSEPGNLGRTPKVLPRKRDAVAQAAIEVSEARTASDVGVHVVANRVSVPPKEASWGRRKRI